MRSRSVNDLLDSDERPLKGRRQHASRTISLRGAQTRRAAVLPSRNRPPWSSTKLSMWLPCTTTIVLLRGVVHPPVAAVVEDDDSAFGNVARWRWA